MCAPEKRVNANNIMLVAAYPFRVRELREGTSSWLLALQSLLCCIAEVWILFEVTNIPAVYFGNLQRQQQCNDEGSLGV